MTYHTRLLEEQVGKAARGFPAVLLTGPRRSGKTTLLRRRFPGAEYVLLEDPEIISRFRADPRGFLDDLRPPVILDEIQNVPELFGHLRARIDAEPRRTGRWFLTGSQEAPLMRGVTESMAGRVAVLELLPLSVGEAAGVSLFRGGFPEVLARPGHADTWFSSYLRTYLERDVRAVADIRDLATFRRFLSLLATRSGQLLRRTELAAPLGVSVPTISSWIGILETTCQILLVPPYFENFGKRLVKSPKLYFADTGLACHLLGLEDAAALERSPFLGPVFEGFVASEIIKQQIGRGRRRELYHFRDEQGLEVDFLVPSGGGSLRAVEAKASRTANPSMADALARLGSFLPAASERLVVHRPSKDSEPFSALRPGVKAVGLRGLLDALARKTPSGS